MSEPSVQTGCTCSWPAGDALVKAFVEEVRRTAVAEERLRWIFQLEAALEEVDPSSSEVNVEWRARMQEAIAPRVAGAVAAEREACAQIAESRMYPDHYSENGTTGMEELDGSKIAGAIRARA